MSNSPCRASYGNRWLATVLLLTRLKIKLLAQLQFQSCLSSWNSTQKPKMWRWMALCLKKAGNPTSLSLLLLMQRTNKQTEIIVSQLRQLLRTNHQFLLKHWQTNFSLLVWTPLGSFLNYRTRKIMKFLQSTSRLVNMHHGCNLIRQQWCFQSKDQTYQIAIQVTWKSLSLFQTFMELQTNTLRKCSFSSLKKFLPTQMIRFYRIVLLIQPWLHQMEAIKLRMKQ